MIHSLLVSGRIVRYSVYVMRNKLNTLEKRLYQLIISRLDGDKIHSQAYREKIFELVGKGIGGFIIFGGKRDEIKSFIDKIQFISEIPLFIASDIERGMGQQIKGSTLFPCQMAVSAAIHKDRPEEVAILREAIKAIAHEAIDVGINTPLIPVLDVNQNPDNPIICTRAFSDNPEDVSWFGTEYIRALEDSGLISCAKHFPGHGDTSIDSHISLPTISKSYSELMNTDILPFMEAIRIGVSSIMAGHLYVPALDSMPASLSKKVITDLLRKELGFRGLIFSDALNMAALTGIDDVPARCIDAGVDVLLHPSDADLTVKGLISAVRSKGIDEGCIDVAIGRILKAKSGLRHIKRGGGDYHKHNALSKQITDMSITLMKHKTGILPINDDKEVLVIIAGEVKSNEPSPSPIPLVAKPLLGNVFPSWSSGTRGGNDTSGLQGDFMDSISSKEIAIFAIFSGIAAWRGSSGIDDEERMQVSELIRKAKRSIVISFGSPYVLRHFKEADILIAAYEANEQTQEAVIKCLKGEMDFKGRMSVRMSV